MIGRAALIAALFVPDIASARADCAGIARLTGTDGHNLRGITADSGRGGEIGLFAGRRQIALPEAGHCSVGDPGDGGRSIACTYPDAPLVTFARLAETLRRCMRSRLPVDTRRAPLYPGATDMFALQRMQHRRAVRGGAILIDIVLIEAAYDDSRTYVTARFAYRPGED